jgi:hypothetical protein
MDISKLLDMLSRRCLFLSRLDLLGDPFEGSITKVNYYAREADLGKQELADVIPVLADMKKKTIKSTFVSCWYNDNHESEAMWKLYCPDNKGVAVQTSYKKLVESVDYDNSLYIGVVRYIDYETEWFPQRNLLYPVMHKRKAFQHEREVRIVKSDHKYMVGESPSGIYCDWDAEQFVENIYINPYAQPWYYEVVKDVVAKFGCKINIQWSSIKGESYY